jgi:hypothetical protein
MSSWIPSPLKSYLTSTLQSALSQYVLNVDLEALGVLGSTGIVARDVELRLDGLNKRLDLQSSRGFVKELRISIPWTALLSQPSVIELRTVEVVLVAGHPQPRPAHVHEDAVPAPSARLEDDSESSWIRQTLRAIVANATLEVHNVIVKYQRDDVVLSTSLKSLKLASCDPDSFEIGSQKPFGKRRTARGGGDSPKRPPRTRPVQRNVQGRRGAGAHRHAGPRELVAAAHHGL